jgi:hypothetical protein
MEIEESIKRELQSLEEQLLQPETRQASNNVAALLADDFIEIGSSGRIFNKKEVIKGLQNEGEVRWILSAFKARCLASGIVLVTYRAARQDDPAKSPIHSLRSSIWKSTEGRWQMVFHQGTSIDCQ